MELHNTINEARAGSRLARVSLCVGGFFGIIVIVMYGILLHEAHVNQYDMVAKFQNATADGMDFPVIEIHIPEGVKTKQMSIASIQCGIGGVSGFQQKAKATACKGASKGSCYSIGSTSNPYVATPNADYLECYIVTNTPTVDHACDPLHMTINGNSAAIGLGHDISFTCNNASWVAASPQQFHFTKKSKPLLWQTYRFYHSDVWTNNHYFVNFYVNTFYILEFYFVDPMYSWLVFGGLGGLCATFYIMHECVMLLTGACVGSSGSSSATYNAM